MSIIRSSPVLQFLSVTARNMSPSNATTRDLGTAPCAFRHQKKDRWIGGVSSTLSTPRLFRGMLIITKLNPLEGNVTSLQEIPDGIGGRAPTLAVETDVTFGIPFLQRAHETRTIWSILG